MPSTWRLCVLAAPALLGCLAEAGDAPANLFWGVEKGKGPSIRGEPYCNAYFYTGFPGSDSPSLTDVWGPDLQGRQVVCRREVERDGEPLEVYRYSAWGLDGHIQQHQHLRRHGDLIVRNFYSQQRSFERWQWQQTERIPTSPQSPPWERHVFVSQGTDGHASYVQESMRRGDLFTHYFYSLREPDGSWQWQSTRRFDALGPNGDPGGVTQDHEMAMFAGNGAWQHEVAWRAEVDGHLHYCFAQSAFDADHEARDATEFCNSRSPSGEVVQASGWDPIETAPRPQFQITSGRLVEEFRYRASAQMWRNTLAEAGDEP